MNLNRKTRKFSRLFHRHKMRLLALLGLFYRSQWQMISLTFLACSQTLYFLFKVRRARVMKTKKPERFNDRQRKG